MRWIGCNKNVNSWINYIFVGACHSKRKNFFEDLHSYYISSYPLFIWESQTEMAWSSSKNIWNLKE